jgi:hypothetical protein
MSLFRKKPLEISGKNRNQLFLAFSGALFKSGLKFNAAAARLTNQLLGSGKSYN